MLVNACLVGAPAQKRLPGSAQHHSPYRIGEDAAPAEVLARGSAGRGEAAPELYRPEHPSSW